MTTTDHPRRRRDPRRSSRCAGRSDRGRRSGSGAHRPACSSLLPLLALVGVVHAKGMCELTRAGSTTRARTCPRPGRSSTSGRCRRTRTSTTTRRPAGSSSRLWSMLTDGFGRHATAIGFGNECMLIAKVVSAGLLYVLGRRLGISPAGRRRRSVLLFGLCPLELVYSRWTFLDNLVTPWLLLAFVLAYSPRRSIAAATGAAHGVRDGRAEQGDRADPAAGVRLGVRAEPGPAQPLRS